VKIIKSPDRMENLWHYIRKDDRSFMEESTIRSRENN